MLFLDHTHVKHCKLQSQDKPMSGVIYNDKIFVRAKAFPKEELEAAIKECREEYLDHPERSQIPTLLIKGKNSVGIWMENKNYNQEHILEITSEEQSVSVNSAIKNHNQTDSNTNRLSLRKLCSEMRSDRGVEIKTRRHKLKLFQRCFLGNEAVDWLSKRAKISRPEAIKLGQKMLEKGLFHHVLDEHQFEDEAIFYRFHEDEGKSIWNSNV